MVHLKEERRTYVPAPPKLLNLPEVPRPSMVVPFDNGGFGGDKSAVSSLNGSFELEIPSEVPIRKSFLEELREV